jgi:hypothetical protein
VRSLLAAAVTVVLLHGGAKGISWHVARPSDSVARSNALSETWDLRAVAPDGRRAIVVRFWTKDNPYYLEWLWYQRGRGVASYTTRVEPAPHAGPGVSMKEPFGHGSIRRVGSRWLLDASGSLTWRLRAHLVLRTARPGITLGPLPASARSAAWLSVVATGLVDGVVETPSGRLTLRGWYGAHVHEWATYRHSWTQAYVRRDLALLWRSPRDIRLVWGLEPFRRPTQANAPDDSIWRGISARLSGARPLVCAARVRRGGLRQGALTYAQPTTTLAARCRGSGSTLALRHPDGKIGGTAWVMAQTFTGLATSNVGGVGFLEQTIPGD